MQSLIRLLLLTILTFMVTTSLVAAPLQDLRQEITHPQNRDKVNACLHQIFPELRGRKTAIYDSGLELIADNDFYVSYMIGVNEPEWTEKYLLIPDKGDIIEYGNYNPWLHPIMANQNLMQKIAKLPRRPPADRFYTVTVTLDRAEKCVKNFEPRMTLSAFTTTLMNINLQHMEKEAKITRKQRLDMTQKYLQTMAQANQKIPAINLEYFRKHPQLVYQFFPNIAYLTTIEADVLRNFGLTIPDNILELPDTPTSDYGDY